MITIAQFGLKNCVLRMTSATCSTGINLKLSTSPSDILFSHSLQSVIKIPLEKRVKSENEFKMQTYVVWYKTFGKYQIIAE